MIFVHRFGKHQWSLSAPYFSRVLSNVAKPTPGMKYNAPDKSWYGYADAVDACCRKLNSHNAPVARGELPTGPIEFGGNVLVSYKDLRDYQVEGVKFLLEGASRGVLLADDMGLGKSAQALRAARVFKNKTLIICVSYARDNWAGDSKQLGKKSEVEKWWPEAYKHSVILSGTKPDINILRDAQVAVIHYDVVHAWVDILIAFWGMRTLIIDEIQYCKSESSRRSKAVKALARVATIRIGLSGTPMMTRPKDLWNVVDTLSEGRFGSNFFDYGIAFCNGHKEQVTLDKVVWDFNGVSNESELKHRLTYFMLRRTKADVASELPLMTREIVYITPSRKYQTQVTPFVARSKTAMRRVLNVAADGKLREAMSLIKDYAEGRKVIVFTYRRKIAEHVVNCMTLSGIASDFIHGLIPRPDRLAIVKKAITSKKDHVLAATIDSMGTSIDLSYANVCVFLELTWEPNELAQCEARLHRIGQINPVLVIYIIAKGTGDELILKNVIGKLKVDESIFGSRADRMVGDLDSGPKGQDALDMLALAVEDQEKERLKEVAKYKLRKVKSAKAMSEHQK